MKRFRLFSMGTFLFFCGILLSIIVISPFFHKGYFPTHDGEWAVVRAGEMFREIRDQQFPPRYSSVLNFGYGYPLFNFAYPFPYYLATVFHLFKLGFVDSIKIIFAGSMIISFAGMFFLSYKFWKNIWAGFVSAVFYVFLPYHLVDLYVRGSIGESLSFALYPLLLLCCIYILEKRHTNISLFFLSILSAVLITTHNIAAVYFGIIFIAYILALFISRKNKEALITIAGFLWGALISAFFFVPALLEKRYIKLSSTPIADRNLYYVNPAKLLLSSWGYGTPTDARPFTYQLGLPQFIGFLVFAGIAFRLHSVHRAIAGIFLILSIIFILMMFPFTSFTWKAPLLSEINYPWTLLLPIGFLTSFLAGSLTKYKITKIISLFLVILSIFLYLPYAAPSEYIDKGDSYYLTNPATTTSSNEFMPLWVKKEPVSAPDKKVVTKGNVSDLSYTSKKISFTIQSLQKEVITVNQIYYPGWNAFVGERQVPIKYTNNLGVMQISVPDGQNKVTFTFAETKARLLLDAVSLLSLLTLLGFGIRAFWNERFFPKVKTKKQGLN